LGFLDGGGNSSGAEDVSADGFVIVGVSDSTNGIAEAFRYTPTDGMVGLGDLPGGGFFSIAYAVSDDGLVVVGTGSTEAGDGAFRWTSESGMVGLGSLFPGGISTANATNADGSVVVGASDTFAVIWRVDEGLDVLQSVLTDEYGLDLTGWRLESATGISSDGTVIVGVGRNPQHRTEAWMAVLAPTPACAGDITGDHRTTVADFNIVASHFAQTVAPHTNGDLSGNGFVNVADFNILAGDFGCGAD